MTYIKWKDEVESYLVSLPQEEKQKIFSYFSEMYADKRDAGKSEEQIIEEFGAPYDVARRILADSRDAAMQGDGAASGASVAGGNNYNYNYYNYNYGGAPQNAPPQSAPAQGGKEIPEKRAPQRQAQEDPFAKGIPMPPPESKKKRSAARVILNVFLTIVLVAFSISLIGGALSVIVEGFVSMGATAGALASAQCGGAEGAAMIGLGLVIAGVGFMLLAPFSALCGFLWRKLRAFIKGV